MADSDARPRWPMIVLRTPKGWTGPKGNRRQENEGYWRTHQVPMGEMRKAGACEVPRRMDEELSARTSFST